jgi:hypothetical protein
MASQMPPKPRLRQVRTIMAGTRSITCAYASARVQVNCRYNEQVRRYNHALWERPMDRRNVFWLPIDCWTGEEPIAQPALPKKMSVIRQVAPAQWVAWAPTLNLDIRVTDTLQVMVDRYLVWLGLAPGSNRVRRA